MLTVLSLHLDLPIVKLRGVEAQLSVPYGVGNYTYVPKPVLPQRIENGSIPVGANWTYIYPLVAGRTYHVYCYGDWIHLNETSPLTDYDIYVFDPDHELVSYHTEAAGLPEHLGTTVEEPYFIPEKAGNYSFQIVNDPRESNGSEAATFMVIEHIETDVWYSRYMEGCVNSSPVGNTSWAYEFVTPARQLLILIRVPDTLDMYEARLYLMATPSQGIGTTLSGVPLPEEAYLYGNYTGGTGNFTEIYGGYNLYTPADAGELAFRVPERTASCEYPGQDMMINYTAPYGGETLYHLILIAEVGAGDVEFMVKTDFDPPTVSISDPPTQALPDEAVTILAEAGDNESRVAKVLLNYTTDGWKTQSSLQMSPLSSGLYGGEIPGLPAGTIVQYLVQVFDLVGNSAIDEGSYTVKYPTQVNCSVSRETIRVGEDLTVSGRISHGGVTVTLVYESEGETVLREAMANATGFFTDTYTPTKTGTWTVQARWEGNATCQAGVSSNVSFTVQLGVSRIDALSVSPESVTLKKSVTVSGILNPSVANREVIITFIGPDGPVEEVPTTTGGDGSFTTSFKPTKPGTWTVQATFPGDDQYQSCASAPLSFTAKKPVIGLLLSPPYLYVLIGGVGAGVAAFFLWRRYFWVEEEEE
ncbi:hypothetical protein CW700_04805 [Candidatus Bathyarchaeota archaeon]|nr:MAG: hypothetical protein CW700_04805 [Candidatus Bathyarchaeota archaeon]